MQQPTSKTTQGCRAVSDTRALQRFQPPPNFRRDAAAVRTRHATTVSTHEKEREEDPMRKTLIALAATTGLIGLGTIGASAAPLAPLHAPAQTSSIQQADWYCGPRCEYWRHRRWEEHRWRENRERYGYYSPRNYSYGYGGYYGYR
jgi:hypothetical protein